MDRIIFKKGRFYEFPESKKDGFQEHYGYIINSKHETMSISIKLIIFYVMEDRTLRSIKQAAHRLGKNYEEREIMFLKTFDNCVVNKQANKHVVLSKRIRKIGKNVVLELQGNKKKVQICRIGCCLFLKRYLFEISKEALEIIIKEIHEGNVQNTLTKIEKYKQKFF